MAASAFLLRFGGELIGTENIARKFGITRVQA